MKKLFLMFTVLIVLGIPFIGFAGGPPAIKGPWSPYGSGGASITGSVAVGGTLDVTGALTADGLAYPTSDGIAGQYMQTDGSGNLTFAAGAGGGDILADGSVPFTGDQDFGNNYATGLQNLADLEADGPSYWFDGDDDYINIGYKRYDTDACSFVFTAQRASAGVRHTVLGRSTAGSSKHIEFNDSDKLEIESNTGADFALGTLASIDTAWHTYAIIADEKAITMYQDGKPLSVESSHLVDDIDLNYIGLDAGSNPYSGGIGRVLTFNMTLDSTDAEQNAVIHGGPVPYSLQGASNTELMPNQVDRDFSGASAWANVDLNAYDETDDLTITASAIGQYCTLEVASAPTTIGKRYRMTYDLANLVSTWTLKSFDGTHTIGTISADGTQDSIEWVAETTGGYRLVAVADDSSGDFDNFTLKQIGCVGQWESDGVGHGQWIDKSGNELHGTVSGAVANNLPVNHIEKYVDLAVTGDTSFSWPDGYVINYITMDETAGNAVGGGVDVGITNGGGEIVSAHAVSASTKSICTLVAGANYNTTGATDTVYITDADGTGWDSASVEVRVVMQRIDMN